ncbi:hypothetical protein FD754_011844, partial [Muntiacus muntjak]
CGVPEYKVLTGEISGKTLRLFICFTDKEPLNWMRFPNTYHLSEKLRVFLTVICTSIFLSEFKVGRKASETAHNISNTFGPGTANKHTVQQQFKKFCKGEESLQDGEQSGWPSEAGNDQLESHHLAEELTINHSMVVQRLKQTGKVKKLDKWVPQKLTANQKTRHFEVSSSLILRSNNKPFLDRIWLDQEEAPKHFPKPNLHQKRFLNPDKTITSEKYTQQIDGMHQKLQCLQLALVNRKGPILPHDNVRLHVAQPILQKLNQLGYNVLPHLPYSPDLSPTVYHFFKHLDNFLQGKSFHKHMDFHATGINQLISCWQKCVDFNGSYFD